MAGRLDKKVAIVTGAAQGIGATYALALAEAGARTMVCDVLPTEKSVAAITAAGGEAKGMHCDVTDPKSVAAMVAATLTAWGRVDILINNAALFGNLSLKPFMEIESAEWDKVMAVNVRGSFECVKAVVPQMTKQKYGKIVNVASGTVFKGTPMMMHYVTSKGAVVAMTRCLARELGDHGIRVNAIAPGLVMSDAVKSSQHWSQAMIAGNTASRCIKREEEPADLTGTIVYLSAPESDFMTGQTIVVDGGSVMH